MGFTRVQIRQAVEHGLIERVARGLYTAKNVNASEHNSLAQVSKLTPHARICLLSALKFHNLTSQNPHEVWIAIGRKERKPAYAIPPIRVVRFSGNAYHEGLEIHSIEGITVQVYSVAKTVVDLFRYRNKIGIDIAIEALREGWRERRFTITEINRLADRCRIKSVMAPFLESLLA
jgi:predicted transcriptional regulator of viral defense system